MTTEYRITLLETADGWSVTIVKAGPDGLLAAAHKQKSYSDALRFIEVQLQVAASRALDREYEKYE